MPAFNSPMPRGSFPNYHESSPLRDKRDSDATGKQWQKNDNVRWQLSQLANAVSQTNRQVQLQGRRILGMAPQNVSPTPEYYPFKIYKPDLSLILTQGTTFDDDGNPILIQIDYTVPTNLPTTINPNTDGWRIWAMREGLVSSRATYGVQNIVPGSTFLAVGPDFSNMYEPTGAGGAGEGDMGFDFLGLDRIGIASNGYGTPFDYDPSKNPQFDGTSLPAPLAIWPFIIPGDADSSGLYSFALWIKSDLTARGNPTDEFGAQLMGKRYETLGADDANTPFPEITDNTTIPIGFLSSLGVNYAVTIFTDPTALTAYNIQKGDFIAKYGSWKNNTIAHPTTTQLHLSGTLNYRGDFLHDLNLQDSIFYPGDVVKIESVITVSANSSGGISTSITITDSDVGSTNSAGKIYSENLWMQTVVAFTSDPTTDPNWVKISGLYASPQTDPTPNTT